MSNVDGIEQLAPEAARRALAEGALMVDVRETHEWQAARIPGALHVPLATIPDRVADLPRDRLLVLQCAAGARSQAAAAWLSGRGFKVANLAHGIMGWHHAGLPLED